MAADDVAGAVCRVAVGTPLNGTVEVGGPEAFRLDELIRLGMNARNDSRQIITDPQAGYFGVEVSERTLIPGDDAQFGEKRFEDWLTRRGPKQAGQRLTPRQVRQYLTGSELLSD